MTAAARATADLVLSAACTPESTPQVAERIAQACRDSVSRALDQVASLLGGALISVCLHCETVYAVRISPCGSGRYTSGPSHGICPGCADAETPLGEQLDGGYDDAA